MISRNFDGDHTIRVLKHSDHFTRDVNRGFVRVDHQRSVGDETAFSDNQVRLMREGKSGIASTLDREFEGPDPECDPAPPTRT
jgi:hypothetical protein